MPFSLSGLHVFGVCDTLDICAGHDDNINTDRDGIPDGCDESPGPTPGEGGGFTWIILGVVLGIAVLVAAVVVIRKRSVKVEVKGE